MCVTARGYTEKVGWKMRNRLGVECEEPRVPCKDSGTGLTQLIIFRTLSDAVRTVI